MTYLNGHKRSFSILTKSQAYLKGPPNYFFLNALKKSTEYFLKFLFLFESTIFRINNGK